MKRAVILGLVFLVALVALLVERRGYREQEHVQFQAAVGRLRHLDAMFNENLLRARFSLLESYDDFERDLPEMERLTATLRDPPRFVSETGRVDLVRAADRFGALLRERRAAFERFKSRNAVLANSRRYFPVAVSELASRLADAPADRELAAIVQELTRVLLASTTRTDEVPATALAEPDRLAAWAAAHPAHAEAVLAANLALHARQLLAGKRELDALTRQLLALPTAAGLEHASLVYEQELAVALRRTQRYRTLLFAAGALLMLAIASALWAQRGANQRLEARVVERTGQLQAEVEERKRTEAALQSSESFLNSLVETLPVFIFRTDRAGRFTFANQRFCARHGRTRPELVGRTGFDLLPPAEAEQQHALDQQLMAGGGTYEQVEEVRDRDGSPGFIHLIKLPVYDAAGACIGVQGMFLDVTERKQADAKLEQLNRQLIDASRQAGMAEVATGVLHNVGNVLNSVNVSATLAADLVRHSKAANVGKLATMLHEHRADLPAFLTADPRGRLVPDYLQSLADTFATEHRQIEAELGQLQKNVQHIKDIVAMQQSYARNAGVIETVPLADLVDDALRLNAGALTRHEIELVRDYQVRPVVHTDKHKVLQILINLVRNAKYACDEVTRADKRIVARITGDAARVAVAIVDNGVGIPVENLTRIFNHGFTTRKEGHGFGLHSGALAAKELGGSLSVASEGAGCGATFTLVLPCPTEAPHHESLTR